MAQILNVQCKCGNPLIVQCEGEYTILRVYCKKCRTYLINYQKTGQPGQATVVNQTAAFSAEEETSQATVVNQTAAFPANDDAPSSANLERTGAAPAV